MSDYRDGLNDYPELEPEMPADVTAAQAGTYVCLQDAYRTQGPLAPQFKSAAEANLYPELEAAVEHEIKAAAAEQGVADVESARDTHEVLAAMIVESIAAQQARASQPEAYPDRTTNAHNDSGEQLAGLVASASASDQILPGYIPISSGIIGEVGDDRATPLSGSGPAMLIDDDPLLGRASNN